MVSETGSTQTELYIHRRSLEARNLGFRKKRNCTNRAATVNALINFAGTAPLFSHTQIVGFLMRRLILNRSLATMLISDIAYTERVGFNKSYSYHIKAMSQKNSRNYVSKL